MKRIKVQHDSDQSSPCLAQVGRDALHPGKLATRNYLQMADKRPGLLLPEPNLSYNVANDPGVPRLVAWSTVKPGRVVQFDGTVCVEAVAFYCDVFTNCAQL